MDLGTFVQGCIATMPEGRLQLGERAGAARAELQLSAMESGTSWIGAAISGGSESIASDGGFLVDATVVSAMMQRVYQTGELLKLCDRVPITRGNELPLTAFDETSRVDGSQFGGVTAAWLEEGGQFSGSKAKLRRVLVKLKKLAAFAYVTSELFEDVEALDAVLTVAFANALVWQAENAIVNGTGAGQALGILNAGATISVSKEVGQLANTLTYQNLADMYTRFWPASQVADGTAWVCNNDVHTKLLVEGLQSGVANAPQMYYPPGWSPRWRWATLFGRPLIPVEYCPTLGTVGDIILGDFGRYLIGERQLKRETSMHFRFGHDEVAIRWVFRLDGQPKDAAPVTPSDGGDTQSTFITLATRA